MKYFLWLLKPQKESERSVIKLWQKLKNNLTRKTSDIHAQIAVKAAGETLEAVKFVDIAVKEFTGKTAFQSPNRSRNLSIKRPPNNAEIPASNYVEVMAAFMAKCVPQAGEVTASNDAEI